MKLTVYKILDKSNGRLYIGSTTKEFQARINEHKIRGRNWNKGLCEWYPEINPADLIGEVLEVIDHPSDDELKFRYRESHYCDYYRSLGYELYNKRIDATHHSEESKLRISESLKGRPCPESARQALIDYNANQMKGNRHQSHHVLEYEGVTYYSSGELHQKLLSEGYDLTYHQVNNLVGGFFSKKNRSRYPELMHSIKVVQ